MALFTGPSPWQILALSSVAVPLTGTLTETTLATITIPAGAMGANGFIRVSSVWSYTNSANNKIIRARFGGTAVSSGVYTTTASAPLNFITSNRASQSSQITGLASGLFSATANAPNTSSIDTSASTTLVLQGTLALISETITLESYLVEIAYRA